VVVSPIRVESAVGFGRLVAWFTRLVAVGAVATQAGLLGVEIAWAVRDHTAISTSAAPQGGLFAATVVLAGLVFWLTAQMRPAVALARLRRSDALQVAAVCPHDCGWHALPGRCVNRRQSAA